MGRLLCRIYVRDCLVCFASCLSDRSDARLLMGGSEGGFLWRPISLAHLWQLRSFLQSAMSIGTFVWAGRTAAAAAARHATNLLPAAIHRNNRKNKRSALSRGRAFCCLQELIYEVIAEKPVMLLSGEADIIRGSVSFGCAAQLERVPEARSAAQ